MSKKVTPCCIVVLLLCCASSPAAQKTTTRAKKKRAEPVAVFVAAKEAPWQEHTASDNSFSIQFPTAPQESERTINSVAGPLHEHNLKCNSLLNYRLSYTDYPGTIDHPDFAEHELDSVLDGMLAGFADDKPRVMERSKIVENGYPGRFVRFEVPGAVIRIKALFVKNRFYSLATLAYPAADKIPDIVHERLSTTFMNSFKVIEGNAPK